MNAFVAQSAVFGVLLCLSTYALGTAVQRRFPSPLTNPLILSIALCIGILSLLRIETAQFMLSASWLSRLLTPATIALALPLHEQMALLRRNPRAVLVGIGSGVAASFATILIGAMLFGFTRAELFTFLPKSITTAIGMDLSAQTGGIVSLTVAAIILTGNLGNAIAVPFLRLLRVTDPIAQGIALGTSSHAIGTVKAMEMGEIQGAMSSLSIVIAGLMTALGVTLLSLLLPA